MSSGEHVYPSNKSPSHASTLPKGKRLAKNVPPPRRQTVNAMQSVGTMVFEAAVVAMDIDESLARSLLSGQLSALGLSHNDLDIDTLASLLPAFESRLTKALPVTMVRVIGKNLNNMILDWSVAEATTNSDFDFELDAD